MKIHDISPEISASLAVFPGDQKFERKINLDFKTQDPVLVSSITSTCHLGAHADGPNHYRENGKAIHEMSLELYYGPCQVIEIPPSIKIISPHHVPQDTLSQRVLFKTNSFPDPNHWNDDFCSIHPSTIEFLASFGVKLIGIDTPSVDPATSKTLDCHKMIFKHNMVIVEGLVLTNIKPGNFLFCGLPLKIKDADASPIRAILIEE